MKSNLIQIEKSVHMSEDNTQSDKIIDESMINENIRIATKLCISSVIIYTSTDKRKKWMKCTKSLAKPANNSGYFAAAVRALPESISGPDIVHRWHTGGELHL